MQEINKNIDHLFNKAKKAKVDMSIDQVQAGIIAATTTGVIATISTISKTKFLSIMIVSGIAVTATVLMLNAGNSKNEEVIHTAETKLEIVETDKLPAIELVNDRSIINYVEETAVEEVVEPIIVEEKIIAEIPEVIEPEVTTKKMFAPLDRKPVGTFHSIVVGINCDVELLLGDSYETEVLQSELENVIEYTIKNGVMTIGIKEGMEKEYNKVAKRQIVEIELTMPSIQSIEVLGSAVVHSDDRLKSDELNLSLLGSGDIVLSRIEPSSYNIELSGSGDVALKSSGSASTGRITINGSGDVWVGSMKTNEIDISINGSGDVNVNAVKQLNVKIAGSGDICYEGDPEKNVDITGSGEVRKCTCNN